MALKFVTHVERPDLNDRWNEAARSVWPEFGLHDAVVDRHWSGLREHFPDCQLFLIDDDGDRLVGIGSTVPVTWDGTVEGLNDGVDDVLNAAIGDRTNQPPANTLCALQAALLPGNQGHGLSTSILLAMRDVAARREYSALIAPVRPNQKPLYPLIPMARYMTWTRSDGLPRDAWMRVHARLGASILRIAERSMVVKGTVAQWEEWTGLAMPESGEYVVTGALTPVTVDVEADLGVYVEPNVWMRHPVPARSLP
jgi:hypothetical protein